VIILLTQWEGLQSKEGERNRGSLRAELEECGRKGNIERKATLGSGHASLRSNVTEERKVISQI
jgi:hypothetical protein